MSAAEALAPYDALAAVYDRWIGGEQHQRWATFVDARLRGHARTVLDVCCGTGRMAEQLAALGYRVAGVDRSTRMLEVACARLGQDVDLRVGTLAGFTVEARYDAAVCSFDSINYVPPADLPAAFGTIAAALTPGAHLVFDVNSRTKLEQVFGDSHFGDDFGDFAYVWRNRADDTTRSVRFLITLFTRIDGSLFQRQDEEHVQYWYHPDQVRAALAGAGFTVLSVTDDYGEEPADAASLRETWVARLDTEAAGAPP